MVKVARRQKTCTHSVVHVSGQHEQLGQLFFWPPGQVLSVQSVPQVSTVVQPASAVGARHARATARKRRGCEAKENW